jgi:hypothetical protein
MVMVSPFHSLMVNSITNRAMWQARAVLERFGRFLEEFGSFGVGNDALGANLGPWALFWIVFIYIKSFSITRMEFSSAFLFLMTTQSPPFPALPCSPQAHRRPGVHLTAKDSYGVIVRASYSLPQGMALQSPRTNRGIEVLFTLCVYTPFSSGS